MINQKIAQMQGDQPGLQQPQDAVPQGQEEGDAVTQEEQQQYEEFVMSGLSVLNSASEKILQMLQSMSQNPAEGLAKVATTIVMALDEKAGGNIPGEIIMHGSAEILENVATLANESGVIQVDEKMQGRAAQLMYAELGDEYGWDEQEMQAAIRAMSPDQLQSIVTQQQQYAEG